MEIHLNYGFSPHVFWRCFNIYPIILASASPRRKKLLQILGLDFKVIASSFEKQADDYELSPSGLVTELAGGKAAEVARIVPEALVIAADTIVVVDDRILGKPSDEEEARQMLSLLSGRWHEVYTGLALVNKANNKSIIDYVVTKVHFRNLSETDIINYVKTREPMDKAGAYGIQGLGAVLTDRIEGCFFNVMGLPLARLAVAIKEFGIDVLGVNGFVRSLNEKSAF